MLKRVAILSIFTNLLLGIAILIAVQKLGGWKYLWFKLRHGGVAGVYEHRKSMFEALPMQQKTIVFLGDSLTEYCEWAELLQNPLVQNRGLAGDGVGGVLHRLPYVLESQPTQLFLMIGVNDLLFHQTPYILSQYEKILANIKKASPSTEVIVQSVLPVNNTVRQTAVSNPTIQSLNKGIASLAQKYGMDYLDLYPHFLDADGNLDAKYTVDGIHLNGKAYLHWKKYLKAYL